MCTIITQRLCHIIWSRKWHNLPHQTLIDLECYTAEKPSLSSQVSQVGYCFFMKLAMNSEDLQDLILTMAWFSGGKWAAVNTKGTGNANPKLGGETTLRSNLGGKKITSLVPSFLFFFLPPCVLLSSWLLISSPVPKP